MEHVLEYNRSNPKLSEKRKRNHCGKPIGRLYDCHLIQVDTGCFGNGSLALGCVIKDRDQKIVLSACQRL